MIVGVVILCAVLLGVGVAEGAILLSDGFESGDFVTGGWTTQNGDASVAAQGAYTGSFGAQTKKTSWYEKAVSTTGYSDIHVRYVRKTAALDAGEFLYAEWYDGSSWNQLEATQDTDWAQQDWTLSAVANNNSAFKIRFRANANHPNDKTYVDDVEVTGTVPTYSLNTSSTASGSVTVPGEAGPYIYDAGTVVTLTAAAEMGYHFVNWTGDTAGIGNVNSNDTAVTMNGNYTNEMHSILYINLSSLTSPDNPFHHY